MPRHSNNPSTIVTNYIIVFTHHFQARKWFGTMRKKLLLDFTIMNKEFIKTFAQQWTKWNLIEPIITLNKELIEMV